MWAMPVAVGRTSSLAGHHPVRATTSNSCAFLRLPPPSLAAGLHQRRAHSRRSVHQAPGAGLVPVRRRRGATHAVQRGGHPVGARSARTRRRALPLSQPIPPCTPGSRCAVPVLLHPAWKLDACPHTCDSLPHALLNPSRHTRHRPGFLIRYAYDAGSKKLHAIGSKALLEKSPELAREVRRGAVAWIMRVSGLRALCVWPACMPRSWLACPVRLACLHAALVACVPCASGLPACRARVLPDTAVQKSCGWGAPCLPSSEASCTATGSRPSSVFC